MKLGKFVLASVAALPFVFGAGASEAQQIPKIRFAWVVPVANSPTILWKKPELTPHLGKTYDVDLVRFQGTPPMIQALAAGEINIALFAYSTFAIAVQNAGMSDLRAIADEGQEGVEGYYSSPYMVLKDGPIKKVADMKGHVAATVGAGAAVDIAMRAELKKAGLEDKRDYTMVEAGFANMKALLLEKKVDLVSEVQPFANDPELNEKATTLFRVKDGLGGPSEFVVWAARKPFLDKNKAAMQDMMEDAIRALHWYMDPKNHDAFAAMAAEMTKLPAAAFANNFTHKDLYRDPNMKMNLEWLQRAIDVQQSVGLLKSKLEVKGYADTSFVDAAAERVNKKMN